MFLADLRPRVDIGAASPWKRTIVQEREWHASQVMEERADGRLQMTLTVCNDYALRAWILGFGPDVRVVSPVALAATIYDAADRTRRLYARERAESRFSMLSMREAG